MINELVHCLRLLRNLQMFHLDFDHFSWSFVSYEAQSALASQFRWHSLAESSSLCVKETCPTSVLVADLIHLKRLLLQEVSFMDDLGEHFTLADVSQPTSGQVEMLELSILDA